MEDQADVDDLRSNRLAEIEKVLLGRVSKEECALQATADRNRVLLSSTQKSFPVRNPRSGGRPADGLSEDVPDALDQTKSGANALAVADKPIFGTRLVVELAEMMILAAGSSGAEIAPCSTTRLRTKR